MRSKHWLQFLISFGISYFIANIYFTLCSLPELPSNEQSPTDIYRKPENQKISKTYILETPPNHAPFIFSCSDCKYHIIYTDRNKVRITNINQILTISKFPTSKIHDKFKNTLKRLKKTNTKWFFYAPENSTVIINQQQLERKLSQLDHRKLLILNKIRKVSNQNFCQTSEPLIFSKTAIAELLPLFEECQKRGYGVVKCFRNFHVRCTDFAGFLDFTSLDSVKQTGFIISVKLASDESIFTELAMIKILEIHTKNLHKNSILPTTTECAKMFQKWPKMTQNYLFYTRNDLKRT